MFGNIIIELIYDPAVREVVLGFYPKKTQLQKDICCPVFSAALFTITKIWKPPMYLSTEEWIK